MPTSSECAYLGATRTRYCGSAEMFHNIRTESEILSVYMTRAPHSRTCLPLGVKSDQVTLVVLIVRTISSHGNIPHSRYAPKATFRCNTPKVLLFLFLCWWPVHSSNPLAHAKYANHRFVLLILQINNSANWVRICRSKIGKLVCQAQSAQIFAKRNSRTKPNPLALCRHLQICRDF